jgi:hypothetical protein
VGNLKGANRFTGKELYYKEDTLSIGQDSIPFGGCSGILQAELREIELALANSMRRLNA